MITKVKQNFTALIYSALTDDKFVKLSNPRKHFIAHILWLFASVKGKINFLQLKRFSNNCEQYFRINFENKFNFQHFNLSMIQQRVKRSLS